MNSTNLAKNILMAGLLSGMTSCAFQEYEPTPIEANETINNLVSDVEIRKIQDGFS